MSSLPLSACGKEETKEQQPASYHLLTAKGVVVSRSEDGEGYVVKLTENCIVFKVLWGQGTRYTSVSWEM